MANINLAANQLAADASALSDADDLVPVIVPGSDRHRTRAERTPSRSSRSGWAAGSDRSPARASLTWNVGDEAESDALHDRQCGFPHGVERCRRRRVSHADYAGQHGQPNDGVSCRMGLAKRGDCSDAQHGGERCGYPDGSPGWDDLLCRAHTGLADMSMRVPFRMGE